MELLGKLARRPAAGFLAVGKIYRIVVA